MKSYRVTTLLVAPLLFVNLATVEAQVLQPSELCSDHPDAAIATFEDANLEAVIRGELSFGAQDDLTCRLVSGLTELDAYSAGIESLVGAQNLTSLSFFRLRDNSITDITPLRGLTRLDTLNLSINSITEISALSDLMRLESLRLHYNSITDIRALSGLTRLTFLNLHDNSITDIGALSELTGLTVLYLENNSLSDITALSGLTSLTTLDLGGNAITDISALTGLTSLEILRLNDNPALTDMKPLVDNGGLGAGDEVNLAFTSVSCTDITALRAKGVTVISPCS